MQLTEETAKTLIAELREVNKNFKKNAAAPVSTHQWVDATEITARTEWDTAEKKRQAREKHKVIFEKVGESLSGHSSKPGRSIYRYDINSIAPRYFIQQKQSA